MQRSERRADFPMFGAPVVVEGETDEAAAALRSGWTTARLTKCPSEYGKIIGSGPPYSRRKIFILRAIRFGSGRTPMERFLENGV
jgi:hypothetical protein